MAQYTLIYCDEKIIVQPAPYIEDGWYIEIIGTEITLWEIPSGGGEPNKIDEYSRLSTALDDAYLLT